MDKDLVFYVLVNDDIKMSKGKTSGQVAHALSVYMYHDCQLKAFGHGLCGGFSDNTEEWFKVAQKKIILRCPQSKLEELEADKLVAQFPFIDYKTKIIPIRDKGLTEIEPNTLTCVGVGLIDRNNFPQDFEFIKELKLLY